MASLRVGVLMVLSVAFSLSTLSGEASAQITAKVGYQLSYWMVMGGQTTHITMERVAHEKFKVTFELGEMGPEHIAYYTMTGFYEILTIVGPENVLIAVKDREDGNWAAEEELKVKVLSADDFKKILRPSSSKVAAKKVAAKKAEAPATSESAIMQMIEKYVAEEDQKGFPMWGPGPVKVMVPVVAMEYGFGIIASEK